MKKNIVEINKEKGVYQITTTDERWYTIGANDLNTGLPYYKFIPSITWITGYVFKGIDFYKWLAKKGWDEAEALKVAGGDKGSKVHTAVNILNNKGTVKMTDTYITNSTNREEELNPEEYSAIVSYSNWFKAVKPRIMLDEYTVISEEYNFAGTTDLICYIKDQLYVVDYKTSQYVWPSMRAQISAYKRALIEMKENELLPEIPLEDLQNAKLAVLQLGYKRNKKLYKFTEIKDGFNSLFLPALQFWKEDTLGQKPSQVELPLEVDLGLVVKESEEELEEIVKENIKPKKSKKKSNE